MNTEAVRAPLQALLAVVENDRRTRLDAIEARVASELAAVLGAARHGARKRVGEALAQERRRLQDGMAAQAARQATGLRLARQRRLRARLERAWQALPLELEQRWQAESTRHAWLQSALDAATVALAESEWCVRHAPGWPDDERVAVAAEFAARGGPVLRFEEDATLRAGLGIHAGANTVDASLRGLMSDRSALGASLAEALSDAGEPP